MCCGKANQRSAECQRGPSRGRSRDGGRDPETPGSPGIPESRGIRGIHESRGQTEGVNRADARDNGLPSTRAETALRSQRTSVAG